MRLYFYFVGYYYYFCTLFQIRNSIWNLTLLVLTGNAHVV